MTVTNKWATLSKVYWNENRRILRTVLCSASLKFRPQFATSIPDSLLLSLETALNIQEKIKFQKQQQVFLANGKI